MLLFPVLQKSLLSWIWIEASRFYFTGTINEINDGRALVDGAKGNVFVTFQSIEDITESMPAQIKTLSVELID